MTNMPNTIRNALAMLAILGITTFMLAACGGGNGNGNGEPPPPCPEGQVRAGEGGRCIPRTQPRCGEGEVRQGEMCIRRGNRAPRTRGSIPDQTLRVGGTVTIDLSRYFTDPDGDRLTYSLTYAEGQENQVRASISGDSLRIQGVTPPGSTIRVYARDPSGSRVYQDFTARVSSDGGDDDGDGDGDNRAPRTRGSIPDQTLRVGGTVTIDLSRYFTDPDGDSLTYSLTFSEGQENQVRASVSGDSLRIQGVTPPGQTIRVYARDPSGSQAQAYHEFKVNVSTNGGGGGGGGNRAPQGSIPNQTLTVGEAVTIDLSRYFTDPDGDRLTYSLVEWAGNLVPPPPVFRVTACESRPWRPGGSPRGQSSG